MDNLILIGLVLAVCGTTIYVIITLSNKILNYNKRNHLIENFASYRAILEYYMELSYTIIHKDRFLIYSIEATRPSDNEVAQASKEFCKLVLDLLGTNLYEELTLLFGGDDSLYINMIEFFNSKYEDDEIRDDAITNLMNKDD